MKNFIIILLAIVIVFVGIFTAVYFTRIQTMMSIEKITDYSDGYDIYSMDVKYNFNTQNIIDAKFNDTEGFVNAVAKEVFPLLPIKVNVPSFGCSVYAAKSDSGDMLMGRNYDFKLNTSCMLMRCNPKNGYKSISFAALNNVSANKPTSSLKERIAALASPFNILDGINEKGVSIAVLTLDSDPVNQNSGKEKISTSLALRLVLDNAATTQEAVDLLRKYDMLAANGRDYHFYICDASGDARGVEYDCESPERTFIETPTPAMTNFFIRYIDKVKSKQRNGIYGHGRERYEAVLDVIKANNGVLNKENSWKALKSAATEPNPESVTSNTQWSAVYNNTKRTVDIVLRRHWGDVFSFKLDK